MTPTYFYHVAPPGARAAIEQDGLLWASPYEECDLDEQGVYLFDNLRDAHRFGRSEFGDGTAFFPEGYDIWYLCLETRDTRYLEEDPLETGGWMYQTECALEPTFLARLTSVG